MTAQNRLKILYVSDSLGTPIHARGIFNYSVSLVEILKKMGADVTLVVEQAKGFGLDERIKRSVQNLSSASIAASQLAEVYRYFNDTIFSFNWRYQTKTFRFLAEKTPFLARLAQKIEEKYITNHHFVIENDINAVDFVPAKGEHLRLFDKFLFLNRFYSSSMSRALNGMDPIAVDATNYDLVIVDTPHFVRVHGIESKRIVAVFHDLIPLRDPTMGPQWRQLFFKKALATVTSGANIIFVSKYTQNTFYRHFPDTGSARKETILYPTIRTSLMKQASHGGEAKQAEYMQKFLADKAIELTKKKRAALLEEREFLELEQRLNLAQTPETLQTLAHIDDKIAVWDQKLPYFATALSDEPRKNIGILVKAFSKLKSVANLVVIGEIDGGKYIGSDPDKFPNVHFTGYLPETDKIDIIRHSAGLIFPSFSEGFGIPIVEGAVLGVPVICSDIPVFHEIGGDLATYFDPYQPSTLEEAIKNVLDASNNSKVMAEALQVSVLKRFSQAAMAERLSAFLTELGFSPTQEKAPFN